MPATELAKEHRLRRICQRRKNGSLIVPESIHEQWKAGGTEKQKLMQKLDIVGWDRVSGLQSVTIVVDRDRKCGISVLYKAKFRAMVTKEVTNERERTMGNGTGYYTEEEMRTEEKWSKTLDRS